MKRLGKEFQESGTPMEQSRQIEDRGAVHNQSFGGDEAETDALPNHPPKSSWRATTAITRYGLIAFVLVFTGLMIGSSIDNTLETQQMAQDMIRAKMVCLLKQVRTHMSDRALPRPLDLQEAYDAHQGISPEYLALTDPSGAVLWSAGQPVQDRGDWPVGPRHTMTLVRDKARVSLLCACGLSPCVTALESLTELPMGRATLTPCDGDAPDEALADPVLASRQVTTPPAHGSSPSRQDGPGACKFSSPHPWHMQRNGTHGEACGLESWRPRPSRLSEKSGF